MAEEQGSANEMEAFRRLDERFQEVDPTLGGIVDQFAFYAMALRDLDLDLDPRTAVRVVAFTRLCAGVGWVWPKGDDADDDQYDSRRDPFALMSHMEESGLFESLEQLWVKLRESAEQLEQRLAPLLEEEDQLD